MARSLGLARVPTLDPKGEGEYPSYEYVRALVRTLDSNFEILNSAFGGTSDLINLMSGIQQATVATSQSTTSSSYTDLGTVGPSVTVATKTTALVLMNTFMSQTASGSFVAMSVAVSGDTTIAADDNNAIFYQAPFNNAQFQFGGFTIIDTLNEGVNTFTAKYKIAISGTGGFLRRRIAVIPLSE